MLLRQILLAVLFSALFQAGATSEPPAQKAALSSRSITLEAKGLPISEVLEKLRLQSGISIRNALGRAPTISDLKLDRVPFWQAADEIARAVRGRIVVSAADGSLQLARAKSDDRPPPTSYDGNFRVRLVRTSASRELDSDRSHCICGLELVWLPSVRPLFLEGKIAKPRILDMRDKSVEILDEGSGLTAVDGRFSYLADWTLAGLPRTDATIKLVEGQFVVIAPSRFLHFRFDADLPTVQKALPRGPLRRLVQSDVVCRVDRLILSRDRWTVQIGLEYPAGGKTLESFQAASLVVQNEMRLVSANGKRTLAPSSYVVDAVSSRRAQVSYHFVDRPGAPAKDPRDWRINYTAPERLIAVPVRFSFKNVPLP